MVDGCVYSLSTYGTNAAFALPLVVPRLKASQFLPRLRALNAIESFEAWDPGLVPELIPLLRDPEWMIRDEAIRILANLGPQAKAAMPAIVELLPTEEAHLKESHLEALAKIDPDTAGRLGHRAPAH